MDIEIYNSILKEGGIDPMGYDIKKKRKYPNGERAFRHDIFKGKSIWLNDKKEDFKLFVASYHPMLGVLFSPKHHPYTKRKRVITLSMMLCVGSLFAALSALFTVIGANSDKELTMTDVYIVKFGVSICNGIVLFLLELCLRKIQSCSCRENTENGCCNSFCKLLTRSAVCCWCCIAIDALTGMIIIVYFGDCVGEFFTIFTLQFLISWLLQIGGLYLKFRKGWNNDKKIMDKLKEAQAMDIEQETEIQSLSSMQRFKNVLKGRKKWKCPYYITYEDSNKWIEAHPEYLLNKQNQTNQMKVPLLSSVKNIMN